VSQGRYPIRSYQRLFRPERRIHQIEGRALPVPGGVPLRWLGWVGGALLAAIALSSGSILVSVGAAAAAGAGGLVLGDWTAALLAAAAALVGTLILGAALGALDWPLRLVVVPVGVASAATQATPDGRRPERFAVSWLALRMAPGRRSLGRTLPTAGVGHPIEGEVWVAPDEHGPRERRARIEGPAGVFFVEPHFLRRGLLRRGRIVARPGRRRGRRSARPTLREGETLEVRP
jgi:hypothetical protein